MNPPPKKRTAAETWKALEEMAFEDEAARTDALTDEEVDAEMRALGFDPAAEYAEFQRIALEAIARAEKERAGGEGEAVPDSLRETDDPPHSAPPNNVVAIAQAQYVEPADRRPRRTWAIFLVAAAFAFLALVLYTQGVFGPSNQIATQTDAAPTPLPEPDAEPAPPPEPALSPAELRGRAVVEFDAGQYREALDDLNEAMGEDPGGEKLDPKLGHIRDTSTEKLYPLPRKAPLPDGRP